MLQLFTVAQNKESNRESVRSALKLGRNIFKLVSPRHVFRLWAANIIINMPKMAKLSQLSDITQKSRKRYCRGTRALT